MKGNGGLMRLTCALGGLGACSPRKILKFRVLLVHSGAVLVYTSELRVQLTSAHTRTNWACKLHSLAEPEAWGRG